MNRRTFVSALATVPLALRLPAAAAEGQNWANAHGPHGNGASDESGLPSAISRTDGVKWSTERPGPSAGTPIIFGDLVYITAAELQAEKLWAICLDRVSGAVRWKHDVGSGYK